MVIANGIPSTYKPTVSLYKFQFSPTAALRAVYIGSTSILGADGPLGFPNFCSCDDDAGRGLEESIGVDDPPGIDSERVRVVMMVNAPGGGDGGTRRRRRRRGGANARHCYRSVSKVLYSNSVTRSRAEINGK
jgi:hypothetical protein